MNRRQFTAALAALPAGLGVLSAETQQERARRVVAKAIDALGGDAFRLMPGRVETGRAFQFYADDISGLAPARIHTKYLAAPQGQTLREVQRQVFGKKDEDVVILTESAAWDITYRGARKLPDERIAQFREGALTDIFYILRARMDEPNVSFFSQGGDVVENQPVEVVDFYDGDNRNVTVWFHSGTFLPVRQLVKRWSELAKERQQEYTRFTKYRDAGNGVMWPHDILRDRDGEKTFQLYADSVKVGPLDDSLFRLPPGQKMWVKQEAPASRR